MSNVEAAVNTFGGGAFNCCQAMVSTYGQQFGMDREVGLSLGGALGGGLSNRGAGTCGAILGSLVILGLKHRILAADDDQAKMMANSLGQEFVSRFAEKHGSTCCKDLLGYDVSSPEGLKAIMEKNLLSTFCPTLIRSASEILEELLK